MRDKRGLSDIIVTIVLIGLALAAIVIVWAVVSGLIKTGTNNIDISGKCMGITVDATHVICDTGFNCTVNLERTGTGTDVISGVKFVIKNSTANSGVIDVPGNIEVLAGKTVTIASGLSNSSSIGVTAYFNDNSGVAQICSQTQTYNY
jgi:hypothetical protein